MENYKGLDEEGQGQRTFFWDTPEEILNELCAVAFRFLLQQIAFQSALELDVLRPGNLLTSPWSFVTRYRDLN
jgi:hypothetical protein